MIISPKVPQAVEYTQNIGERQTRCLVNWDGIRLGDKKISLCPLKPEKRGCFSFKAVSSKAEQWVGRRHSSGEGTSTLPSTVEVVGVRRCSFKWYLELPGNPESGKWGRRQENLPCQGPKELYWMWAGLATAKESPVEFSFCSALFLKIMWPLRPAVASSPQGGWGLFSFQAKSRPWDRLQTLAGNKGQVLCTCYFKTLNI